MYVDKIVKVTAGASSRSRVAGRFRDLRHFFARLGTACFGSYSAFGRVSVNVSRSCPLTIRTKDAVMHMNDGVFKSEMCWGQRRCNAAGGGFYEIGSRRPSCCRRF